MRVYVYELIERRLSLEIRSQRNMIIIQTTSQLNHPIWHTSWDSLPQMGRLKKSNSIKITVSRRDRELLEKIKEEVGIEVEVKDFTTNQGYDCSTLEWTDQKHKEDLAKYSIVPEKTFILRPPTNLKREY